jgi:iron complex transport system substrate-binding protein
MRRTSAWLRTPSPARPRRIWCLALALLLCCGKAALAAPVSVTDDDGQRIELAQPAGRVIALYGAFNEILDAMGLSARIVARTEADRTPPDIARLPVIGTHMRPDVEAVLAARPDLVLQMAGRKEASLPVAALRKRGVRVAVFRAESFAELFSVILRVGALTGAPENAEAVVRGMQARLDALDRRLAGAAKRPRVFYEVRSPNLLAAGRGGLVDEIIRRAGGENCVAETGRFARLGEEEVVRLAPEVYIIQRGPMNQAPLPLDKRPRLGVIPAAKTGRAWFVDEKKYARPGPQSIAAAEELAGLLHPEIPATAPAAKGAPTHKDAK